MSTTLSVEEAQAQLPKLVCRTEKRATPCYIQRNGRPVAVLVSVREWRRREGTESGLQEVAAEAHERRTRAYERALKQLGPDYWLDPDQQARLKELVEKEDFGGSLSALERRELSQLLRRHEQLMARRAAAMLARQ
jgi:prevent-host-death family protein